MPDSYLSYVGIDWATESHQVCVLASSGDRLSERSVEHTGPGLAQVVIWLLATTHCKPEQVAVAIEVNRGAAIETLL